MLSWATQLELVKTIWQKPVVREALKNTLNPVHFDGSQDDSGQTIPGNPALGWIYRVISASRGDPLTTNEIIEELRKATPQIEAASISLLPKVEKAEMLDVDRAVEQGRRFAAYQEALILAGMLPALARSGQWSEIRNRTEGLVEVANGAALLDEDDLIVTRATDIVAEKVSWLWDGYIPVGKVSTMEGDGGLGKSTVLLDLAARLTTGRPMPLAPVVDASSDTLQEPVPEVDVVVLSAEDGAADTIKPRLLAAGANCDRVHLVSGVREKGGGQVSERNVALDRDVTRLENLVIKTGAKLVIIDPIVAMLGPSVDFHRDQDVRRVLKALAQMAERRKCAVVTIRHLNKDKDTKTLLYRGGGSIGFVAAVRVAMMVMKHPADENLRVIAVYKTNLTKPPSPALYRFEDVGDLAVARIQWAGTTNRTLEELVSGKAE